LISPHFFLFIDWRNWTPEEVASAAAEYGMSQEGQNFIIDQNIRGSHFTILDPAGFNMKEGDKISLKQLISGRYLATFILLYLCFVEICIFIFMIFFL
jgi:hypothetical protein